mmetsp:Transcript_7432/g.8411  ORF Transcript_7432/g.8411 Transcript_7432/m.8411 type:complete len:207 (+) Transcript_7432:218-838(+)
MAKIKGTFNFSKLNLMVEDNKDFFKPIWKQIRIVTKSKIMESVIISVTPIHKTVEFKSYSRFIRNILPNITRTLQITHSVISNKEFLNLISASKHLKTLQFNRCEINLSKIKISSSIKFSLQHLRFEECPFLFEKSNSTLKDLLSSISKSSLKDSLKSLHTNYHLMTGTELYTLLKELSLSALQVYGYGQIENYPKEVKKKNCVVF